jgi:putative membrane-bound dehydrogenase-like protein
MNLQSCIFLLLFAFLFSCRGEEETVSSFNNLTEEEKRLPQNALKSMKVAEGLHVELFASEPMVTNPTNISVDHRGRVWVCEAYNYDVDPEKADEKGDRIVVLEDIDGDGKSDKRTVFYQGTDINSPLGIFVSGNQVYVSRSPNILLLADTNGDLIADKKELLFTNLGKKGDHSAHSIMPGPDGKLYFSTGNYAGEIKDKGGNAIVDRAGFVVNQKGLPYLGGMVMRFDSGGKNFEVLGHNFRNNYEPAIDSYGNIWQSDNDDDGNQSCRINFIVPYGNYGFVDEVTRAAWTTNRVGVEEEIPMRHWHQNDPGVIPNVLITGAGSPAGMAMYEGDDLPGKFFGMPVHAEPYDNVVRAYLTRKEGAGFKASTENILKSEDQWFRPVDVSTAPDGSLMIADWYDPILGGGAAGDATKGRIFRVSKERSYKIPTYDFSTIEGCVEALKSPNNESRFQAYSGLISQGSKSVSLIEKLWYSDIPAFRARALWLLAKLDSKDAFLNEALADPQPDIRIAAIRFVLQNKDDVLPFLTGLRNDKDVHVRRELLTALRYSHSSGGAEMWTDLAMQHDGNDRWYLEAIGIASDLHADMYFDTWKNKVSPDMSNPAHRDIVWRVRSSAALPYLADIIAASPQVEASLQYFRAFDFHSDPNKNQILLSLLDLPRPDKNKFSAIALQLIDPAAVSKNQKLYTALHNAMTDTRGTRSFIDLVEKFSLHDRKADLISLAVANPRTDVSSAAVDLLIKFNAFADLREILVRNDSSTLNLLESLHSKGNREIINLLSGVIVHSKNPLLIRQQAVHTLGSTWPGEDKLLGLVSDKDFPAELKTAAAGVLFNVYRSSIQREAAKFLPPPVARGSALPSVKALVASNGDPRKGETIFQKLCSSCHRAGERGEKFGPELSQIGSKLSKEGLYRAIIYPDEGISHGYATTHVILKDGTQSIGIVTSETDLEIVVALAGGTSSTYKRSDVAELKQSDHSIMPALAPAMEKQELVDLVTYLSGLKK